MVKQILAGDPLFRNDIFIIAQIIEHSLDYYHSPHSPLVSDYLQALRTLVGLGYTAVLADGYLRHAFEPYLARFLAAEEEINVHPKSKERMGRSAAKMVHIATLSFYKLKFTPHYTLFIALLRQTLSQVPGLGREEEVERILNHLS